MGIKLMIFKRYLFCEYQISMCILVFRLIPILNKMNGLWSAIPLLILLDIDVEFKESSLS